MKAAWLLLSALLLTSAASALGDILVVDPAGTPVPNVQLEFVQEPLGAFGDFDAPLRQRSDEQGRIPLDGVTRAPLDFRVVPEAGAAEGWAIRFVHGPRTVDEEAAPDLLGVRPRPYDLDSRIVCVVERTGTLRIRVMGAKAEDRFHATFVDKRPEPESHRNVQVGGSFVGAEGVFQVPAGRGTVYLAQHGFLGTPAITSTGLLMVAIAPGGETTVTVRLLDGPTARLLAPFDVIPFERIEALAPDGATVIGEFDFDASPLKLGCRVPVAVNAVNAPAELPPIRLPKQLLRAVDVPLALPPIEELSKKTGVPRMVERAPMELLFTVDPGDKVRLPEVAGGWINEAQGGLALVSGSLYGSTRTTGIQRTAPGVMGWSDSNSPSAAGEPWSARFLVRGQDGEPSAFVEALVSVPGSLLARAITNEKGELHLHGLRGDSAAIGLVDSVADSAVASRPASGDEPAVAELTRGPSIRLRGTWKRPAGQFTVGDLIVLVPANVEERSERRRFMTHAAPIAFVDASGAFDFGPVPRGLYSLRAGRDGEATVDIRPVGRSAKPKGELLLKGSGESFGAQVREIE